jgi:hypothetical protein
MKSDYWNVENDRVVEKTGKPVAHWMKVLDRFKAPTRNRTTSSPISRTTTASRTIGRARSPRSI